MHAIIDLGTNTFHLLVAEIRDGHLYETFKMQIPVQLGRGGINQGYITPEAFNRGMLALSQFSAQLNRFRIGKIKAFATSAIRSAENGEDFIEQAWNRYRIGIEAISGEEEASYIYRGVFHSFHLPHENVLVMDIGGGSVEFILGYRENILWKQSFEAGAARLMDHFHHHDPINPLEIKNISNYLDAMLSPLAAALRKHPVKTLVGSAGSFETLVDVIIRDFNYDLQPMSNHAYEVPLQQFDRFYETMMRLDKEERLALRGMVGFRAEMIVVSSVLTHYVLRKFGIQRLIASDYSLKEGVMYAMHHIGADSTYAV